MLAPNDARIAFHVDKEGFFFWLLGIRRIQIVMISNNSPEYRKHMKFKALDYLRHKMHCFV